MAVFGGNTTAGINSSAIAALQALRRALSECAEQNAWLQGVSVTDLTNIGFSAGDAGTLKSAFADAAALWQLYGRGDPQTDGTLPPGYALPYTFGASQRQVLASTPL